ncbi:MAG: hypothetical protein KatS3mg077_0352 [Candidatus Binatia bacterium]|nr:MAG: hypothetical protein KatS3mg077_0352 [Candidatus Binatia bacterium]
MRHLPSYRVALNPMLRHWRELREKPERQFGAALGNSKRPPPIQLLHEGFSPFQGSSLPLKLCEPRPAKFCSDKGRLLKFSRVKSG